MKTDAATENALIGSWVGTSRGETLHYTFENDRHFKVVITSPAGATSKACGYWDVTNGCLRLGTSPAECNKAPLQMEECEFWLMETKFRRAH